MAAWEKGRRKGREAWSCRKERQGANKRRKAARGSLEGGGREGGREGGCKWMEGEGRERGREGGREGPTTRATLLGQR